MWRNSSLVVLAAILGLWLFPAAGEAQVRETSTLTQDGARRVAEAAMAEAKRRGVGGAFAVVGADGALLHLTRLDGTFAAAADVATRKARTAATFQHHTGTFEDIVNGGRTAMLAALEDFTPMRGGVPIIVDDEFVGAIGVSGASSAAEDEELAVFGTIFAAAPPGTADAGAVAFLEASVVEEAFREGAPLIETVDYKVHASHREGGGEAEIHALETDVFYVTSGSATFVTGGEMVDGREIAPGEIRGSGIVGGNERRIQAGDVIIIPRGIPHWFREVDGSVDYYVVKVL
jgi:glc operon protein GlcG